MTNFSIHKITKDQCVGVISTPRLWFECGSYLRKAADATLAASSTPDTVGYVGEAEHRNISDLEFISYDYRRVVEMLYAMAIECWLKGMAVYSVQGDPVAISSVEDAISELTEAALRDYEPGNVTFADIVSAMDNPEINALLEQKRLVSDEITANRYAVVQHLFTHDLRKLSTDIGLWDCLSTDEQNYLIFGKQAITWLGRYPAPRFGKNETEIEFPFPSELLTGPVRESLFRKLLEHHDRFMISAGGGPRGVSGF